jgi:hypothetical protein
MKTYSDLQAIDFQLCLQLELEPVGNPEITVMINNQIYADTKLYKSVKIKTNLDLVELFFVEIELKNKTKLYPDQETAVQIKLQIDGIDLLPRFDYLAKYVNDQDNNSPTSYLGYNGKWRLTFDRPFYQWLHQATGQGWLLS